MSGNGDYISREAAKAFFAPQKGVTFLTPITLTVESILATIDNIPAADVRPVVRGRDISSTVRGHCEFKCSVCGVELSSVYGGLNDFGMDGGRFNFCPHCGADMREES